MTLGDFYRYFDRREKPNYVDLIVSNIYGYMKSGKTTLSRKIGAKIEERCEEKKWGFIFIEGRRQQDVLNYIEENKDEIRGLDYIMITYDDAGRFFMSRESATKERRETLKDFMEIRHFFEGIGFRQGIVSILFNIQFYRLLDKTMRNAPMGIWKSMVLMDVEDRREMALRLGWRYYYFLKIITKAMFVDGYRLKISDIKVRSSNKREEIYNWLVNFFNKYNIDAAQEIPMEFAKRFAVIELFDDKFVLDSGNEIVVPKNCVKVDLPSEERSWLPRDREERDKILYWVGYIYYFLKENPETPLRDLPKVLREKGFSFSNDRFFEIMGLVEEQLSSRREKVLKLTLARSK